MVLKVRDMFRKNIQPIPNLEMSVPLFKEFFKPDKRLLVHIEKERSKFFEIVQNLSTEYEELKNKLLSLENKLNLL